MVKFTIKIIPVRFYRTGLIPRMVLFTLKALLGSSPSIVKKENRHFRVCFFFWCERRDKILLRKLSLLNLKVSHLFAKNHSPNGFIHAQSPLRVQVPPLSKKKTDTFVSVSFLVRETGLEPVWINHTHLKRARLPIPPLSHFYRRFLTTLTIILIFSKMSIPF